MREYPHMQDTAFPDVSGVNVYAYRNEFDYTRWQPDTVLKLCNVPWDASYSDVVKFDDDAARDAWFEALQGETVRLTSEFRVYPNDNIKLPVPFATLSRFNYIWVYYPTMTSASDPLEYADQANSHMRYGFFILDMRYRSPNATECVIVPDVWTNAINDIDISFMQLERGHAPMSETTVTEYLSDPINNNEWLLEPESGSIPKRTRHNETLVLNDGQMYACIVTNANPTRDWGTEASSDWWVPGMSFASAQGVPSYWCFAVYPDVLSLFMANIDAYTPQFKQTVKAVFFASEKLLTFGDRFDFGGVYCYPVTATPTQFDLFESFDASDFGYPSDYSNITKLYTYPYASIVVTDERGNTNEIHIEDTHGFLAVNTSISLAFPWVSIDASLVGVGGDFMTVTTFKNIEEREFIQYGNWYDYIRKYNIPVFGVIQEPSVSYDYETYYDRKQAVKAYENAYDSSVNAATAAQSNANASAQCAVDNTALQVTANATMTSASASAATSDTGQANNLNSNIQQLNAGYSRACVAATADAQINTAGVSVASNVINSTVAGAMAGGVTVPGVGAVPGAVAGLASGILSGITTGANTAIAINLETTKTEAAITNASTQVLSTSLNNTLRTVNRTTAELQNMTTQNNASTGMAANTQYTTNANATRTYNASIANAQLARDTAQNAIAYGVAQGNIGGVREWGSWANGENAAQRPMMLSANLVTQSDYDIAKSGDSFLRYGYMCNRNWDFTGWNYGNEFTYWKCNDVWLTSNNVLETWRETVRMILKQGVTVWSNANHVNGVSIYDNGF